MCLKLMIWGGVGLYALLSAADWLLTFALLRSHPGAVEVNPLAAACLDRYGWDGLAMYKFGGVVIVTGAVILLARRRRGVAAGIIVLGCAVLLTVTVYTHQLLCASYHERDEDAAWPKPTAKTDSNSLVLERCWFAPKPPPTTATATLRR
jgi:hypothetical protein